MTRFEEKSWDCGAIGTARKGGWPLFYNTIVTLPRPRGYAFRRQPISPSQLRLKCQTSAARAGERKGRRQKEILPIRDIVTRVHVVTVRIRDGVTRYALCTHVTRRHRRQTFPQSLPRCSAGWRLTPCEKRTIDVLLLARRSPIDLKRAIDLNDPVESMMEFYPWRMVDTNVWIFVRGR